MKKYLIVLLLMALLPLFGAIIDEENTVNAYSPNTSTFEDYLDVMGVATGGDEVTFVPMGASTHSVSDLSLLTADSVYVDVAGIWIKATYQGTTGTFIWYYVGDDVKVVNRISGDSVTLNEDGSVYDDYFYYDADNVRLTIFGDLDISLVNYWGRLFFNEWDYSYISSDLSLSRTIGWVYDSSEDSGGMSALELGTLVFTDGILGIVPRVENEVLTIPMIKNIASLSVKGGQMVYDLGKGVLDWIIPPVDLGLEYSMIYYNIGTWDYDTGESEYRYLIESPGFWSGERLIFDEDLDVYLLETGRFWVWFQRNTVLDDDAMQSYKTETSNFS